jgi:hypothetical protein
LDWGYYDLDIGIAGPDYYSPGHAVDSGGGFTPIGMDAYELQTASWRCCWLL